MMVKGYRKCSQCEKFTRPEDLFWVEDLEGRDWLMCRTCGIEYQEDPFKFDHYPDLGDAAIFVPYE